MGFKDILVHVDNSAPARSRLKLAAWQAHAQQAHLIGLYVDERDPVPPFVAGQMPPEVGEARQRRHAAATAEARVAFEALAPAAGATWEWRQAEGSVADALALHARYADVTVAGQPDEGDDDPALIDTLVMQVGRPVLVVPHAGRFDKVGHRVLVAWNASREATRAVHDALPLLRTAGRVHVVSVNPDGGHGAIPGADIAHHLSRHGVAATCEHLTVDDLEVGAVPLSRAADIDADLLVMGAYGRSRLRQLVMGGTTRHVLHHMTVPVLFSH